MARPQPLTRDRDTVFVGDPAHAVTKNRLATNRLATSRLVTKRLATNRLATKALSSTRLEPSEAAAELLSTADGREVHSYLISCALPGRCVDPGDNPRSPRTAVRQGRITPAVPEFASSTARSGSRRLDRSPRTYRKVITVYVSP